MRKFIELFLLTVSLCLFSFSCTLETAEDGIGSVSITLPGNQVNSRLVSQEETPTKYYIALFYGENATVEQKEGKVRETNANSGETVQFENLAPGNYTLYVRGDAPFCYYEASKNIKVDVGTNKEDIELGNKQNKVRVIIDLSSLANISTFDLIITDINNTQVFSETQIQKNNGEFIVPIGFMPGKYNIGFKTANSTNERYYIDGGNTFEIPRSGPGQESPQEVRKVITSHPIRSFIVDSTFPSEGDGSESSPFKTLKYAVDKAIGSSDVVHEDINITIKGSVEEQEPIKIENGVNITLIGESVQSEAGQSSSRLYARLILDNAKLTLKKITLQDINSQGGIDYPTITLNNSELTMGEEAVVRNEVLLKGSSKVIIAAPPIGDGNLSLNLDAYTDGKNILAKTNTNLDYGHVRIMDERFEITPEGNIKKIGEWVNVSLDINPLLQRVTLKYSSVESPDTEYANVIELEQETLIRYPFTIGKEYKFELLQDKPDNPTEFDLVGYATLTIQKDIPNQVSLSYIRPGNNYYVDSMTGNDVQNTGTSSLPYASINRAISDIEKRNELEQAQFVVDLVGDFATGRGCAINNIKDIKFTSTDGSVVHDMINLTNSSLTIEGLSREGLTLDKVELINSSLSITYPTDSTETTINNIVLRDNTSTIKVLKQLMRKEIFIDFRDSVNPEGITLVDVSAITEPTQKQSTIECFTITNPKWALDGSGKVIINSNLTVTLDKTPEVDRYAVRLYEMMEAPKLLGEYPISGKVTNINHHLTANTNYKLELIDLLNYKEVLSSSTLLATESGNNLNFILDNIVYIGENGIDTNDGKTKETSVRTLQKAYDITKEKCTIDENRPYKIVLCPNVSSVESNISDPLTAIGKLNIDTPIDLSIVGETLFNNYSRPIITNIPTDSSSPFITVSNEYANIYVNNINLDVAKKDSTPTNANEGIFTVNNGQLNIGKNVEIENRESVNKKFVYLGPSTTLTLSDATNGAFTSIYLENLSSINVAQGFATSKSSNIEYELVLSDNFTTSNKVINGEGLTIDDYNYFNVNNDRYINENGMVEAKQAINVTISTTKFGNRTAGLFNNDKYHLKVHHGNYTSPSVQITGLNPNTSSIKVNPNIPYDVQIIYTGTRTSQIDPVVVSRDMITFKHGSAELDMFNILVPGKDENGIDCEINAIKNVLVELDRAFEVMNLDPTFEFELTINLDGDYYRESNWVLGTDFMLPSCVHPKIKAKTPTTVAKIYAEQSSREIITKTEPNWGPSLYFQDITFVSGGYSNKTLFNLTEGDFEFTNVTFENSKSETFIKTSTNVTLNGKINIPSTSPIVLVKTSGGASPSILPKIYLGNNFTYSTGGSKITIDVVNEASEQAFEAGLQLLNSNSVDVSIKKEAFALKSPGGDQFIIDATGKTELKPAP